jgi:UDP-N-acetylmuramoyl-L-alanyl-D-glutamate--2,6-diaminopimelate ligase
VGADPARAAEGAAALSRVPGRWEVIDEGQPWLAIVDYAHTPESLERVLALLGRVARGRVICVFGCGGDRDRGKRAEMGRVAVCGASAVIVTDDNPRSENPEAIAREVLAGARGTAASAEYVAGRERAISRAVGMARPGDALLVAGKGHEVWQEIGDERLPFDDRAQIREAILALGARP